MDNMGNMKEILGRLNSLVSAEKYNEAETFLMNSIAGYTEANPDNLIGQSFLYSELGGFYRGRNEFDKGEKAYLEAKALLERSQEYIISVTGPACSTCDPVLETEASDESHSANYATVINNLAGLYRMSGRFEEAIEYFDQAIEVYENSMESYPADYLASAYSNKGLVYLDLKDTGEAKRMFLKAEEILEKAEENPFAMGTTLSNLAFAYLMEKDYSKAIEYFKTARDYFTAAGASDMAQNCAEFMARLGADR